MKSHFFAYIARMRFITRWALMRNTASENVQEHSHQVAVLAHALAVIRNEKFGGQVDPGAVAAAALYHDATEILTGDMPTPIKYFNPAIRNAYKDVETVAAVFVLLFSVNFHLYYGILAGRCAVSQPRDALRPRECRRICLT